MTDRPTISVSRRSLLKMALLGSTAAALAACGGTAQPAASIAASTAGSVAAKPSAGGSTSSAPATTGGQPKLGGTIRAGQVGDIANLDGHYANQLSDATVHLAYDKLVVYDDKLQPQAALAEKWDVSSDSKTVTLMLRKGVTFHNGREFTSDDVKYNFLRVRDPKVVALAGTLAPQSAWFTNIDTPDKYTVVLTSDKPRPGVFDLLSIFNMVDKDTMEGPNAKTAINGTGPFKFVEWVSGDHITMDKNKNYWTSSRPYVDKLQISILRDSQAMVSQLESGALDVVYAPPLSDTARLKQNPKFQALVNSQLGQFFYMNQNVTVPLFQNKLVRQAMNYALNRQRISQSVFQGLTDVPVNLPWPKQSPAYEPAKNNTYTFDLDKAAALLKQAGVSNASFDIAYSTAGFSQEFASLAQIYQSDLATIGIKTTLKPVDGPTFTQMGQQHTYQGVRFGSGAGAGSFEASTMLQSTSAYNYAGNFAGFKDDKYTELVQAATAEPDQTKRKQLYSQLNDYLLDQCFTCAFSWYPATAIAAANVHALTFLSSPVLGYVDAWLD